MTSLETAMNLAQRASSIAYSPHRHNIQGLLDEMHRASAALSQLIQDARERNDTAVDKDLYRNQGAVKELKQLLKSIKRHEIQRGFDGGYGD